ncbi:MAG: hypothetical protein LC662_02895 [Rhodothermaceae bacterium]|nr:hypothetical protein [Rhodothermaceae bacterium]
MNVKEELSYTFIKRQVDKRKPAMMEISNRLKTHIIAGAGKSQKFSVPDSLITVKDFASVNLTGYSILLKNSSLKDSGGS